MSANALLRNEFWVCDFFESWINSYLWTVGIFNRSAADKDPLNHMPAHESLLSFIVIQGGLPPYSSQSIIYLQNWWVKDSVKQIIYPFASYSQKYDSPNSYIKIGFNRCIYPITNYKYNRKKYWQRVLKYSGIQRHFHSSYEE